MPAYWRSFTVNCWDGNGLVPEQTGGDCRCLSDRHGVRFSGSGRVFSVKDTFSLIVLVSGLYTLFWIYYNISNVFSFERSSIFSGRYSYVTGNDDYFDFE